MPNILSDAEIAKNISQDPDTFWVVIDRYEDKLFRYIMRLWDFSHAEGEDILQEIFIKTYTHINEYNPELSFSSWIYRIAHNTTIDAFRKNTKRVSISLDDEEYESLRASLVSDENIPENLKKKDMREFVEKSLVALSEEQREVIVLKYIEEKNYDEISDILRIPVGTVWTILHRAKKQLQWNLTPIHNHI